VPTTASSLGASGGWLLSIGLGDVTDPAVRL
jgi:hypothetical protein